MVYCMEINGPTDLLGILEGETIGILREKNSERLSWKLLQLMTKKYIIKLIK